MLREIKQDEFELIRPLIEALNKHHNNVSVNFKGLYPLHPVDEKIATFKKAFIEGKSKIALIIDDNKMVGLIKIDLDGVLDYLIVLEEYRHKGYGDELMKWALDEFAKLNITSIELHVVYGNDTVNFYEKYGFKKQSYIMTRK